MRGHFTELTSKQDINFDSKYTKLYYISLNSQMKKLSALMSYITIDKEVSKRGDEEHEN